MSREKKKGTSGNAKAFISRAKALKKLQLSLPEFRRLCILKGIYPRDPKKKLDGADKTYYLRKDIDFLAHERLINTIRAENSHKKKVVKARAKRRIDVLKRLALRKPKARLDHLVLERYPRFEDAVRELDDPLCIVGLFANLPADRHVGLAAHRVAKCHRLLKEFHLYVARERTLKKVFVSIKGYYFQARIAGELVTWVLPHRFSQILPTDVDYSVMLTFLELYECILSFVNFRLYTAANMAYPPKIIRAADAKGLGLTAVEVQRIDSLKGETVYRGDDEKGQEKRVSDQAVQKAQELVLAVQAEEEEEDDEGEEEQIGEGDRANDSEHKAEKVGDQAVDDNVEIDDDESLPFGVFADKSFVLGREVPYTELEFMLMASGATLVTREDDLPKSSDSLSLYTHWVIDRPKIVGERNMSLEYVQPQYVFDSINAGLLLPTSLYGPGAHLPPHLSPFVSDEDDGGYRPWYKDVLDKIKAGDMSVVAEAAAVAYAESAAKVKRTEKQETSGGKNWNKTSRTKRRLADASDRVEEGNGQQANDGAMYDYKSDEERNKAQEGVLSGKKDDEKVRRLNSGEGNIDEFSDKIADDDSEHRNDDKSNRLTDEDEEQGVADDEEDGGNAEDEEDEEGEEEEIVKGKEVKMEQEGKEMAALLLSRKKMRIYKRHKRQEDAKNVVKGKLMSKRKQLESERDALLVSDSQKKRQRT